MLQSLLITALLTFVGWMSASAAVTYAVRTTPRVHVQDCKPNEEGLVRVWVTCVVAAGLFGGGAEQVYICRPVLVCDRGGGSSDMVMASTELRRCWVEAKRDGVESGSW